MAAVRSAVLALVLALCSAPVHAQSAKPPIVGVLYASSVGTAARVNAFRDGMRELGYIDGWSVVLDTRFAEGELDRFRVLADDLVRANAKVIVTGGPAATRAAQRATSTIPIVMSNDIDPVGNGFAKSLALPGGNITGLSTFGAPIAGKQLSMLRECVPGLRRIAVIGTAAEPSNRLSLEAVEHAAKGLGIRVQYFDAPTPGALEAAFKAARVATVDAVLVLRSPVFASAGKRMAALAVDLRLPAIYPHEIFVQEGGLMAYSVRVTDMDRRAASYVERIMRGAHPKEIPIEQPTKYELSIDLGAARRIGLAIPRSLLLRADRVIGQ